MGWYLADYFDQLHFKIQYIDVRTLALYDPFLADYLNRIHPYIIALKYIAPLYFHQPCHDKVLTEPHYEYQCKHCIALRQLAVTKVTEQITSQPTFMPHNTMQ